MIHRSESNTKKCFLVRDQVSVHELRAINAFKLKIRLQEETESRGKGPLPQKKQTYKKQTNMIWPKAGLRFKNPGVEGGKCEEKTMGPS